MNSIPFCVVVVHIAIVVFIASVCDLYIGVSGCSTVLVGKDASCDGSVIASHSDDGEGQNDPRIALVPAMDHGKDAIREVYPDTENYPRYVGYDRGPAYYPHKGQQVTIPIGKIDQVNHTYAYFDGNYGIINEKQVIVGGESTCSGVFATTARGSGGEALFSINELSRLAMERATSAREAITIMGYYGEKFGFYGASRSTEGGSESLMVADKEEGWVFHILPDDTGKSAIWVAERVPDDEVTVVMNMFTIRDVNLTDTKNFMGSDYMYTVAKRHNLWDPVDGPLDFTKTFSNGEYVHKYYSGRRMWRALSLFSGSNLNPEYDFNLKEQAAYPWSVKPAQKIAVQDIFEVYRDYYNGTAFDLSKGLAAGPFHNPDRISPGIGEITVQQKFGRGAWERPIGLFRTTYTSVIQARGWLPDEIGGLLWHGAYAPRGTCFFPLSVGIKEMPKELSSGEILRLSKSSAYWAFRYTHNVAQLRYDDMKEIIIEAQNSCESSGFALQEKIDNTFLQSMATKNFASKDPLTNLYAEHVSKFVGSWWDLPLQMVENYADGFNQLDNGKATGYPAWWLEAVGYTEGPPPP